MSTSPPIAKTPPGFAELQRSEFSRIFEFAIRLRLYVAPLLAGLVLLLAYWEDVSWRWAVMGLMPAAILTASVLEVRRFKRVGLSQLAIEANVFLGVVGQLLISFATGGLESPVMPLVLLIALLYALLSSGRVWYDRTTLVIQVVAPWIFAAVAITSAVPDFNLRAFGGGARPGHGDAHLLFTALVLSVATFLAHRLGHTLRGVFDAVLWRALEANEGLRLEYDERSRAQVTLTAEIAHELKNPLSSVKGLATLLSQNVADARGAERLAVLRQETDRMQEILEEFLTFSRPLLPLTIAPAQLGALCRGVVLLHEGMARAKGVALLLEGDAQVPCDARKLRQILVNLVQNAIEASPRGGEVMLSCQAAANGGASLQVLDRGAGIDPSVRARLFQPGITSKPKGNGIGLTVARALARQHGGELTLGDRPGGGCAALLTLPPSPAVEEAAS